MKKTSETKTKNRSYISTTESNTAECITADLCITAIVITTIFKWKAVLDTLIEHQ